MAARPEEIRGMLAPISGGRMLLPNSVIAEVAAFDTPEPFPDAPDWLLGELGWNDWKVPVISYALLSGAAKDDEPGSSTRILIIRTLADSGAVPYVGLLIQGVPRLATIRDGSFTKGKKGKKDSGVFSEVVLDNEATLVPDLDEVTAKVMAAAYADRDG